MDFNKKFLGFSRLKNDGEKLDKILFHYTNGTLVEEITAYREDIDNWKGGEHYANLLSIRPARSTEDSFAARAV